LDALSDSHPRGTVSRISLGLLLTIGSLKLAAHFATLAITPYEFHRDEFLYMAMGNYLRLWQMDFPPLIAVIANVARGVFGDSLFALRLAPALAGTAVMVLSIVIAREVGGGRMAQFLAGCAVLISPLFLRSAALFHPVVFDQLWWTLGFVAIIKLGKTKNPFWWIVLGIAGGLGLLTKFSIFFFGFGVLVGVVLSPLRTYFRTPWPYIAVGIALMIGSPSIVGQFALGFPVFGQMHTLRSVQLQRVTVGEFLIGQVMMLGPGILLALAGTAFLIVAERMHPYRAVGWACIVTFLLLLLLQGKPYYIGPIYPTLLAAGAVSVEALVGFARRIVVTSILVLIIAYGLLALPFGLPVLPPPAMARYAASSGVTQAITTNSGTVLPLPQDYADMLGWKEVVEAVADAYHTLPPEDRQRAVILASNYGEAGAIDFYGSRYGLPRAVSPAGSYWFFGPGDKPGEIAVALGIEDLDRYYEHVELIGRFDDPWLVPEQRNNPIVVAWNPRGGTLQQVWPSLAGRN
jgi:4-amino-4-deoxy-L-arabinose transferase-like glycosyltransferase